MLEIVLILLGEARSLNSRLTDPWESEVKAMLEKPGQCLLIKKNRG